ncbi:DUF4041 domain-containing protein [Actinoplanes rectilineatus]|uniref:DUF4041 domain-containing protein n=1 Tax=Actinoplanes rectilineatus TaxID=113571 RepID=UPI001FDFAE3B|nr:DUF4041 domain-containing protein [Actinoplanes rectilineatus]
MPPQITPATVSTDGGVGFFGARGTARELAGEVERLTTELTTLRAEMQRLGVWSAVELEQYRERVRRETADEVARGRKDLAEQVARAQSRLSDLARQESETATRLVQVRRQVVVTEETALLQEAGVYEYRHPLSDAVAYQAALARVQDRIKTMAKADGGAVRSASGWTVNGSAAQGRTMIRDYSKLMLRAYNAEADNLVRGLKPYRLDSAVERLGKVAATIARLGKTMDIRIDDAYHRLRIEELQITADYVQKVAEEKEREREEKARLREERKVQQEIERERARLDKERAHYLNALEALNAKGDAEGAGQLRERLAQIETAIHDVDYRAANIRAGYVYVISNIGAFGDAMIKVGLTRRLDPMDRVKELSDASVPFNFDVHALFFSEDAVGIESAMHARLADKRVNRVNYRREFFYATPAEAKSLLAELAGNLLQYQEVPEALEFRQSLTQAQQS